MSWFKLTKAGLSDGQEALATRWAVRLLKAQRSAADWLNIRTANWSARCWLLLLWAFCLGFGSYCLWLLLAEF